MKRKREAHLRNVVFGVLLLVTLLLVFYGFPQGGPTVSYTGFLKGKPQASPQAETGSYAITTVFNGNKITSSGYHSSAVVTTGVELAPRFLTDEGVPVYLVEGSGSSVKGSDASNNLNIHYLDEFEGKSSSNQKIDQKIYQMLKKNKQVPVIIRFSGLQNFYSPGNDNARADRKAKFLNKKTNLNSLLKSHAKLKNDLLIINGVSADIDADTLALLQNSPDIEKVDADAEFELFLDESVPEITADQVWNLVDSSGNTITGIRERIAIIDSGVDYTHPDLGGCFGPSCKVLGGYDFVNNDDNPMDDNGHGTHVAATAAGKGLLKGVAPDAKILAYKVCDSGGRCPFSAILSAIDYSVDPNRDGNPVDHVDVMSMSLGGSGDPDDVLSTAVDEASAAGVVATISAGNSGPYPATIGSPGTARTAITVAAACKASQIGNPNYIAAGVPCCMDGAIARFSSRGPLIWNGEDIQKPDIAAPGVYICAARWDSAWSNTCFDDEHVRISGTSMAAPHMAGAVALMRQAYPSYTPEQIKNQLKITARDLGMSYNYQGAGEVNLIMAIPSAAKITSTPGMLQITTDPTTRLTVREQVFSVTPLQANISTLTISTDINASGITLSFNKTTLQVANKGTDTFKVTVTIDNDFASAGAHYGTILLSENGVAQGAIGVSIKVQPTLSLSTTSIYYGVDNPELSSWSSEPQQVTVTNLRTDAGQSINITFQSSVAGIVLNVNPPILYVPANSSANFSTQFIVDNALVPNDIYRGAISVKYKSSSLHIGTLFYKYHLLTVNGNFSEDGGLNVLHIFSRDRKDFAGGIAFRNVPSISILFTHAGIYDLLFSFTNLSTASLDRMVAKEGVLINGSTTVGVSWTEAVHKVQTVPTDISGNLFVWPTPTSTLDVTYIYMSRPLMLDSVTCFSYACHKVTEPLYFSDVSVFRIDHIYNSPQINETIYFFSNSFTGTGDKNFSNTPADFKTVYVQMDINRQLGLNVSPLVTFSDLFSSTVTYTNKLMPLPQKQTIYSMLPADYSVSQYTSDIKRVDCPPKACPTLFASPSVNANNTRRVVYFSFVNPVYPMEGNTIYNGLGPSVWAAKFRNSEKTIKLVSYSVVDNVDWLIGFTRQDYALQEYNSVPFTISKNGVIVSSGTVPGSSVPFVSATTFSPITLNTSGVYEFRIDSFTYLIKSQNMTAKVYAKFNTSSDPNPPAIKRLYFFTDNARSEVYDGNKANRLELELDPVGGAMKAASASFSKDGINFIPLGLSGSNPYVANMPPLSGLSKLTLRIQGVDVSNNILTYTFELPAIGAPAGGDATAPTTSLTSPANGTVLSGTVNVNVQASDNVGVTKVELYKDGSILGTKTASPYTFAWNTSADTNELHTLQSTAYDAAGNIGVSSIISVEVTGGIPPGDQTPPAISNVRSENITNSSALILWDTDEPSNSKVYYGTTPSFVPGGSYSSPSKYVMSHSIQINGQPGTFYYYKVSSCDVAGNCAESLTYNFTTTGGLTCSDGTSYGRCSATKPKYCSSGTLINNCTGCGCPTGQACNSTSKACYTPGDTTPPAVSITYPANGAVLSGTINVSVQASDNVGVTKVELYRNSTLVGNKTTAPYVFMWNTSTVSDGSYGLQSKAYDAAGNVGVSSVVSVQVRNAPVDSIPPVVNITFPLDGSTVARKSTVVITANATDNVGVTKVQFYINSQLVCSDTTTPYSCSWRVPAAAGKSYTLMAKAYDAAYNVTGSAGTATVRVTSK
jgi:subtilisin family serine protease